MHDLVNTLGMAQSLDPQTITVTALDTGAIDRQGSEALAIVLLVGAMGDVLSASARIDVKIEHADDDGSGAPGSFTACADEDVLNFSGLVAGVFLSIDDAAKAQKRHVIGYRGGRRFVKMTASPTGLTSGGQIAMLSLSGSLHEAPADNG